MHTPASAARHETARPSRGSLLNRILPCFLLALLHIFTTPAFGLSAGDRVRTNGVVNVRSSAAGASLGTQQSNALGTIIGGPTTATLSGVSYTWWNVNFDSSPDGWVASIGIDLVPPATPTPSISSVNPSSPIGSNSSQSFTINGANFVSGANIILRDRTTGETFSNRTASSFSSTQITINPNFTTAAHSWSVEVINPSGQSSGQYNFSVQAPSLPAPSISSLTPSSPTGSNSAQALTINGSNFVSGANITLRDKTTGEVFANRTASSLSSSQIVINPVYTTAAHNWSVEVINPDGKSTGQFNFTVQAPAAPAPSISGVSPASPTGSATTQPFTVTGSNFVSGANIILRDRTTGEVFANRTASSFSATQFVINPNFTTAAHDWGIEIVNPDGKSSGQFNFSVRAPAAPAPSISSVSPASPTGTATTQPFTITGLNFVGGANIILRDRTTGEVFSNRAASSFSVTQIVINPNFTTAAHDWSVEVINPDGKTSGQFNFSVHAPAAAAPSIGSVSPASPTGSTTSQAFTINGTNFVTGANITLRDRTTGEVFANRTASSFSATQIVINPVFTTAAHGWSVEVINPDGKSTGQFNFNVQAPAGATPSISGVSPTSPTGSPTVQPFTINGSNFATGATITLRDRTTGEVFANRSASSFSPTQIVINPIFTTAAHDWSVEVINPDGKTTGQFNFSVLAPASSTPAISGVTPASPTSGPNSQTFTITGSNFASGANITLRNKTSGEVYPNRTSSTFSLTQIVINPIFPTAGDWSVEIINPDRKSSGPFNFTVQAPSRPAPVITALNPTSIEVSGNAQTLTITGTGFQDGAAVTMKSPRGASTTLTPRPATAIALTLQFIPGTEAGTWTAVVNNPDGQSSVPFSFAVKSAAPQTATLFARVDNASPSDAAGTTTIRVANAGGGTMRFIASVSTNSPWLKLTPNTETGTNTGTIGVSYEANTSLSERTATVSISASDDAGTVVAGSPFALRIVQKGRVGGEKILPGAFTYIRQINRSDMNASYKSDGACGPCSTVMVLTYLDRLPLPPKRGDGKGYGFAWYVAPVDEKGTPYAGDSVAGYTFSVGTPDIAGGTVHYGAHGYLTQDDPSDPRTWPNRAVEYLWKHGVWARLDTTVQISKVYTEIDAGRPVILSANPAGSQGHIIFIRGYNSTHLIAADPWIRNANDPDRDKAYYTWEELHADAKWMVRDISKIENRARVRANQSFNLRDGPNLSARAADRMVPSGDHGTVLSDPALGSPFWNGGGYTWVRVQWDSDGRIGWSAVGQAGTLWIEPDSTPPAAATADTARFAGSYSGKLSSGADVATFNRPDGSGTLLAYFSGQRQGLVADYQINPDGTVAGTGSLIASSPGSTPLVADRQPFRAALTTSTTFTGRITNGTLTGTFTGGESFSLAVSAPTGSTAALAGLYVMPQLNSASGKIYSIVNTVGEIYALSVTAGSVDGGKGSVTAAGTATVQTAGGTRIVATMDASAQNMTATVNPAGATQPATFAGVADRAIATNRLANVSTRGKTGAESQVLIAGFVITGATPKTVLIRAVGPTLAGFGVSDALRATQLQLFRSEGGLVAENSSWSTSADAADIAQAAQDAGAFALPANSKDATLLVRLAPGAYSALAKGADGSGGVVLLEVYEAGTDDAPKLLNISTRGQVAAGDGILIAGFVVTGNSPKSVLIRAVGPTLSTFGVAEALGDPTLKLLDSNSRVVASNDNWGSSSDVALLSATTQQVGAFALPTSSKDAALLITLAPGAYTVQAAGVGGSTGVALLEIYEAP